MSSIDSILSENQNDVVCKPITGRLDLILGPMFASKTTELIRYASTYKSIGKKIMLMNHIWNNRYGTTGISSHNHQVLNDCICLSRLGDIMENEDYRREFEESEVILIEELQFFTDAYDNIVDWIDNQGKCVVAAGLDGDFRKQPFGDVLRLIPHAEEVKKLKALCRKCCDGTEAHFTKRTTCDQQTTLVGSDDIYEPVCRYHFLHDDDAEDTKTKCAQNLALTWFFLGLRAAWVSYKESKSYAGVTRVGSATPGHLTTFGAF
jgi:thymidine kinase